MSTYHALTLILASSVSGSVAGANGEPAAPGRWDVTSTVVELAVPGVPGFLVRMMRGKSKAEHKRLADGQGLEALLAPDPKAQCRTDNQQWAGGRYAQTLTCPQKRGEPLHVARSGTFDRTGFVGTATVTGTSPKGAMRIVLNQRAARVGN